MQHIKFGFGRATRDACRMIQNNQMTREDAIKNAKMYDNEFPENNLKEVLSFLNLSKNQLDEVINKHRNNEIWQLKGNNWELVNKIYE